MQLYKLAKFIEDENCTNCITIQCTVMGDMCINTQTEICQTNITAKSP